MSQLYGVHYYKQQRTNPCRDCSQRSRCSPYRYSESSRKFGPVMYLLYRCCLTGKSICGNCPVQLQGDNLSACTIGFLQPLSSTSICIFHTRLAYVYWVCMYTKCRVQYTNVLEEYCIVAPDCCNIYLLSAKWCEGRGSN